MLWYCPRQPLNLITLIHESRVANTYIGVLAYRYSGINGVLVRLATCKRLTNSLPKLSLITLFPPETAGYQVGRIYGWMLRN